MKRLIPTILLAFSVICTMCLSGCGMQNQHAKAIQTAIIDYSDYFIEVHDLSGQVKEQYKKLDKQQSAIDYTILVDIPDYSTIDLNAVGFIAPVLDYASTSASQYRTEAGFLLRTRLEAFAYDNPVPGNIELSVTFSLTKAADGFSASISGTSRNAIKKTVDTMVSSLLESYEDYTQSYQFASIADARFRLLNSLFGSDFAALSGVSSITETDEGIYELSLVYPDPNDIYTALAQQYYESYNQPFYGDAVTISLNADDLSGIKTSGMRQTFGKVTVALDANTGVFSLIDTSDVASQIAAAQAEAETIVERRVNQEWRIPELEIPINGKLLEGKSSGNEIVFVSDASLGKYCYVRFYLLPGEDVNEDGTLTAGMFLIGGKKASVHLPSGYYRIDCYAGDAWYGTDALFGPDAVTFGSSNSIRSQHGYINTISFE